MRGSTAAGPLAAGMNCKLAFTLTTLFGIFH
jgi:hypothetical protein